MNANVLTVDSPAQRFEELMQSTYKRVYNMAFRLAGNRTDAEDLTQEAYLRAYRSFDRYDGDKPFENWIFRIVSRLFLDLLRYRSRRVQAVSYDAPIQADEDEVFFDKADTRDSPEAAVLRDMVGEELEAVLMVLDENQRRLIELADIEGRPYREIAAILGTPVGTIRSRVHRIHKMLRKRLLEWEQQNPDHTANLRLAPAQRAMPAQ